MSFRYHVYISVEGVGLRFGGGIWVSLPLLNLRYVKGIFRYVWAMLAKETCTTRLYNLNVFLSSWLWKQYMYSLQFYRVGLYSTLHSFTLTTCCRALMLQHGDPHELQTNLCGQLMLQMIEVSNEIPLQTCYVCNQTWLVCCAHLCQATLTHMCSILKDGEYELEELAKRDRTTRTPQSLSRSTESTTSIKRGYGIDRHSCELDKTLK